VRELLPLISAELPGSVRITPIYDRSRTIVTSVADVEQTLLIAFVLVVVVIFLFLGRAADTLIPAVALPLSLLLTFVAMQLLGYSLDNLSLMALTLAIGFLVDDAIVFLENTVRRMERAERGPGSTRTWMERAVGGAEKRVLAAYGASLWWFLRHRWVSALTWLVCLVGTGWLFMAVPKAFLPTGDSSFVWGVMIAREGSSPAQMRALQDQADEVLRQDPAVGATFTMTGNSQFLASNQGFLLAFLKPPAERAPIQQVVGRLMGQLRTIPGVFPFLRPFPVLEISTGATNQNQGQYAFALSGVNPDQVYDVATRLTARLREYPGFATLSSDYFNNTPNLDINLRRAEARTRGVSETRIMTLLRNAYSQNYLYLIKKPTDQYQVILEADDAARS